MVGTMLRTRGERLRAARLKHFKSARLAAIALHIPVSTYGAHERAQAPGGGVSVLRKMRLRWPATLLRSDESRLPMRSACRDSIVATLAQRTTEGAGSPARRRSETTTSFFHLRFSALVIIRTHSNRCPASIGSPAITSAGRR